MKRFWPPLFVAICAIPLARAQSDFVTGAQVDALRAQIRQNFFVPDPLPPLHAQTHRRFSPAPGVVAEAVTYATELGTRVPAIVYLPDPLPRGGKIPGVIVVNGHGGDKYSWYAYYAGVAFARGGAAVLTYDQAGEGERSRQRKSGAREHDKLEGDERMARRLCGLMLTDVFQATTYLAARPEVDRSRIAAVGYSMGSFVLAIAGATEPRWRACVLAAGGNLRGAGDYWDHSNKLMCQALPWRSLDFLGRERGAAIYALQAARGPTLIWNGRVDNVVAMPETHEPFFDALRAEVVRLRGGDAKNVFEYGFTDAGGHRPYFVTKPAALWLERQIDFPNWTDAQLRAMPETHIADWAQRTGVPIDSLYATEEREGGTMAIGADVPAITREQLSVFTPGEWTRQKQTLMFDAWVAAAKRAEAK